MPPKIVEKNQQTGIFSILLSKICDTFSFLWRYVLFVNLTYMKFSKAGIILLIQSIRVCERT